MTNLKTLNLTLLSTLVSTFTKPAPKFSLNPRNFVLRFKSMKSVSGKILSSKPVSLSKASKILSKFVSFENGASQPVSVYLRRASAAFAELTRFHKELKPSRSHRKNGFKNYNLLNTEQIPEEDGVERCEDGSKSKKNSNKENPVTKEGGIDGEREGKREKKKKSESVERESGSSLGVELMKRKEKKKRKGGENDDEAALDLGEQKKKKRRIEGNN